MTKLKRTAAAVLTGALLMTALPAGALAAGTYTDVPGDAWYSEYLSTLTSSGVVAGYPDGTFRPAGQVTLGETLRLTLSAAGYGKQAPTGSHWASGYRTLAVKLDMLSDGAELDAPTTRLETARYLAQALGFIPDTAESPYTDVDDGYVTALHKAGIVFGEAQSDGSYIFRPEGSITRAELCSLLYHVKTGDIYAGKMRYGSYWVDVIDDLPVSAWSAQRIVKKGIDVSYYQKEIDWAAVKAEGIDFAMLRLGYRGYESGKLVLDTQFINNIRGATAVGIDVGVYFFSQAISVQEALEEAAFVTSYLKDYKVSYPVCFDWEPIFVSPARTDGLDRRTLTAAADAFCGAVADAGYTPSIYFTSWLGYTQYDLSRLKDYEFWFAQYSSAPAFYYDFAMWQYSSSGYVNGIEGKVDMNYSVRDYAG